MWPVVDVSLFPSRCMSSNSCFLLSLSLSFSSFPMVMCVLCVKKIYVSMCVCVSSLPSSAPPFPPHFPPQPLT